MVFHIADFHLQSQFLGYLARTYHGVVLTAFGLFVLFHVNRFGFAVHPFDFLFRFQVGLLDLKGDEASGEGDHTDVVSRSGFHGHDVAFFQRQTVAVVVISLARVLELHLHEVGGFCVTRDVCQVIVRIQLFILSSATFGAKSPARPVQFEFFLHSLSVFDIYYCMSSTIIFRAKSKNTIRGLTFCSMSRCASLSSSIILMTFRSLTKRAKFLAKSPSCAVR